MRLHVFEDRYKTMIGACLDRGAAFGVVLDRAGNEVGDDLDPASVGTTAKICEVTRLSEGRLFIVTRGVRRFRVDRFVRTKPFWTAEVSYLEEPLGSADAAQRLRATAAQRFRDYLQVLLDLSERELDVVELPDDPTASSFLIADAMQVEESAKQALLESPSVAQRLMTELEMLDTETQRLRAARAQEDDDDVDERRKTITVRISLN